MSHSHPRNDRRSVVKTFIGLSSLIVGAACSAASNPPANAPQNVTPSASIEQAADRLAVEYGQRQMRRLAKNSDRDSLIAAALIGSPNDAKAEPAKGHEKVMQRLVREYSTDSLALYTASLICHVQLQPCAHAEYQSQLLRLAPDNAVHFLLIPNAGRPSAEQLHLAALAGKADTHFSALLGIVRSALADQPAPQGQGQIFDGKELALILRRNEIAAIPWPKFSPTVEICSAETAARLEDDPQLHADCSNLGLALFSDDGHNIVTRMFGGSIVRRFAKGTPAEAEAKEFRRQYVWMSELPDVETSADKEKLNEEEVLLGEWEAFQRHAERAGVARIPPVDWVPKNPQALLLPEERTPEPANK